jgi:hypothetical protein
MRLIRRGNRRTGSCIRVKGVSNSGVLDTQWERRGAYGIRKQQSETGCGRRGNSLGTRSEDTVCNKTKQRGFEDVASERIRHSHAQCKNNERILGIVPRVGCLIPCVDRFKQRANNADQQNKCDRYSRRAGSHGLEYSVSATEEKPQNQLDITRRVFLV